MITEKHIFQETEQLAGHIVIDSGSLLVTDGIWDTAGISNANKIKLDLGEDKRLRIPVTTILQNGRRFVILDIDGSIEIEPLAETVTTEEHAAIPEKESEEELEGAPYADGLKVPQGG